MSLRRSNSLVESFALQFKFAHGIVRFAALRPRNLSFYSSGLIDHGFALQLKFVSGVIRFAAQILAKIFASTLSLAEFLLQPLSSGISLSYLSIIWTMSYTTPSKATLTSGINTSSCGKCKQRRKEPIKTHQWSKGHREKPRSLSYSATAASIKLPEGNLLPKQSVFNGKNKGCPSKTFKGCADSRKCHAYANGIKL
jgi:hypothetical protein